MSFTISSHKNDEKIAVILWLYHTSLWNEFLDLLLDLSDQIVLYIGLYKNNISNNTIISDLNKSNLKYKISYHDNYGADVASFLKILNDIDEELFIKIHSKKSTLGKNHQILWRQTLLHDLIGSKNILKSNKQALTDSMNGMVCNKNLLLYDKENNNKDKIKILCSKLNLNYEQLINGYFPAGNMFMSRKSIFTKYFTKDIVCDMDILLKNEIGKVNDNKTGKYAHSLERIFGYIITNENLKFCHPTHEYIKVLNTASENGFFKLIVLYDNSCYLFEDLHVFGKITKQTSKKISIAWHHLDSMIEQQYVVIDQQTITKEV